MGRQAQPSAGGSVCCSLVALHHLPPPCPYFLLLSLLQKVSPGSESQSTGPSWKHQEGSSVHCTFLQAGNQTRVSSSIGLVLMGDAVGDPSNKADLKDRG